MWARAIIIIGLLMIGFTCSAFVTPAFADRVFTMDKMFSEDRAVNVYLEKVVESDTSSFFSPYSFPPDQYKFITLYYSLYNTNNVDTFYLLNMSIKDQQNRYFDSYNFITGETIPANGKFENRVKYYAVYRNSTHLWLVWTDRQPQLPWNQYDTIIDINFPSPTPTPGAATPVPTPTPTATPTPTPTPGILNRCLPFLPLGIVTGGVGGLGIVTRKYRMGR